VPATTWIAVVAVTELVVKSVIVAKAPSILSPAWGRLPGPVTKIMVPPPAGPEAGTTRIGLGGAGGTGSVPGGVVAPGVVGGVVPAGVVVDGVVPAGLVVDGAPDALVVGVAGASGVKVSGFDGTLSPKAVNAVTSNWYAEPLVKPPTVMPVFVVCAVSIDPRYTR
jgi:hypothetical protein